VERSGFGRRRAAAAAEHDGEDVVVEKSKRGCEHSTEVGDGQKGQWDSDDCVKHGDDHPGRCFRRYVPVTYHTHRRSRQRPRSHDTLRHFTNQFIISIIIVIILRTILQGRCRPL